MGTHGQSQAGARRYLSIHVCVNFQTHVLFTSCGMPCVSEDILLFEGISMHDVSKFKKSMLCLMEKIDTAAKLHSCAIYGALGPGLNVSMSIICIK